MWEYFEHQYPIFLFVSLQLYLQNRNNTLFYLDSIDESKKQSQVIKDLLALESLFSAHMQELQSFESCLRG